MMWDAVMERVRDEILANATLVGIFSSAFRMAGTGVQTVPSLEWTLISDLENELWAPMIIQFDLWTKDARSNREAELALRGLYHRDIPRVLADLRVWMEYNDGSQLATPDRSNIIGRAIRFKFTPLRRQYAVPV